MSSSLTSSALKERTWSKSDRASRALPSAARAMRARASSETLHPLPLRHPAQVRLQLGARG